MKVEVRELTLRCRQGEERVPFGPRLSFFHGEMSTGKSTIVEMINFCLGGTLVKTPAVSGEVVGVQLDMSIGETDLLIERSLDATTKVDVTWQRGEQRQLQAFPLAAQAEPVVGENIFNLSDFLLGLLGMPVLKVRTSKSDPDSDLHRISFRDFFKFNYLDQDDLDSSFFLLETPIRMEKSKDVLRYVLGFHSDHLNTLEAELAETRQMQRVQRESAKQIDEFLARYGFNSESQISEEIDRVNESCSRIEGELSSITPESLPIHTLSEEERTELGRIEQEIAEKKAALNEIDAQLRDQQSLVAELLSMKFKVARSSMASELLDGATFHICPSCGTEVEKRHDPDTCPLCKSHVEKSAKRVQLSAGVVERDLTDRIEDLNRSIKRLERARVQQQASLSEILDGRSALQRKADSSKRSHESQYMQRIRALESELGALNERRRFLVRVRKMPSEIEARLKEADKLSESIHRLQREIAKEQEKFEEGRLNVAALEMNFLKILQAIHFPAISDKDTVRINVRTWMPYILPEGNESRAWTFSDAGSGGKKVLFKISFALALHLTSAERKLSLPKLIIIDSTMKNITPDINPDIVEHFYDKLYALLSGELADWQCILVDQTFVPPSDQLFTVTERKLTKNAPEFPPLISYYHGH